MRDQISEFAGSMQFSLVSPSSSLHQHSDLHDLKSDSQIAINMCENMFKHDLVGGFNPSEKY